MPNNPVPVLTSVLLLAALAVACERTGQLEGDLYLLTQGGEVRRGAANEVALIPHGPALIGAWDEMCANHVAEVDEWTAEYDSLAAEFDDRIAEVDDRLAAQEDPAVNIAAPSPADREYLVTRLALLETRQALLEEIRDHSEATRDDLLSQSEVHLLQQHAMLRAHAQFQAPTGMNAHYEFAGVPLGDYWLFASMQTAFDREAWLIPVRIEPSEGQSLDLDNTNVGMYGGLTCDNDFPEFPQLQ